MSNDLVPEETEQEYTQFLTILRSASKGQVPITAEEQTQIIAQVRTRLASATSTPTLPEAGVLIPQHQFVPHSQGRQTKISMRFVAHSLAVLVVIGLILGSWALFRSYPSPHRTAVSTVVSSPPPATQAQANGLEASMRMLIGGPYFLGELLPIDVSFTNHTQRPAGLGGSVRIVNNGTANSCFPSALLVRVTKGSNPSYSMPELDVACTQPYIVTEVQPGRTITIHEYVPLTKSGEVTLTRGILPPDYIGDPLDRRWPTVHMQVHVNPQVSQDRILSLLNHQGQVIISVPAGVKVHLLYMQSITCDGYSSGNPNQWTPLSTNVLHEPACPTAHQHWTYVVGAPGYAIASGSRAG